VTYSEKMAFRVRKALARRTDVVELKMFGGLGFMVGGHMCCGVIREDLMVRVGRERFEDALAERHARPMDFTGMPLTGFVYVAPAGCRTDAALRAWVRRGTSFVATLPVKKRKKRKPRPRKKR